MGAMSSKYNDTPATASRPYDVSRDGFVIAGGAGVVVLEELEHARRAARASTPKWSAMARPRTATTWSRRRAKAPSAACAWRWTVKTPVDYINPHATSTPAGDPPEIEAIRKVFGTGDKCPPIALVIQADGCVRLFAG